MLLGHYIGRVGEKGRVALPASFRRVLGKQVVVARWYEKCLTVVAQEEWEKLVGGLGQQRLVAAGRDTDRFLLSGAFEIELDEQGRFVVPQALREYANLEDEVVFAGVGVRVELWDRRAWEEYQKGLVERAPEMIEELAGENG